MASDIILSASVISADPLNLERDLTLLAGHGFGLHFDLMDGHFVPRFGLHLDLLARITATLPVPVDVHLMVSDPLPWIDQVAAAGASLVTFHLEAAADAYLVLNQIRAARTAAGNPLRAGVALRPLTPLAAVEPLLDQVDAVLLMAYAPGTTGQAPVPGFGDRIEALRRLLEGRGRCAVDIIIDGGVSQKLMPRYRARGANGFVFGSAGLFTRARSLADNIARIRRLAAAPAGRSQRTGGADRAAAEC